MEANLLCPQCNGTGSVCFEEPVGSTVTVECPTCEGEGMVDAATNYVYAQEQKALCDCPGGADRIEVIEGQTRCGICGRLVQEAR